MHVSVLVAAISVGIMVLARLFMGVLLFLGGGASIAGVLIPILVALLILYGVVIGHRLAWQWGRLLGLVGGVLLMVSAVGVLLQAAEHPEFLIAGALLAMQGLPLFPMFFALGTQGAREHFRLICPQCSHARPKGGNFFFTKAICPKCQATWV